MRRTKLMTSAGRLLLAGYLLAGAAGGWGATGRFPSDELQGIRLTVFYPSRGTVEDLLALRREGALSLPGLSVVGVYHSQEKTDYEQAREFIRQEGIDWMTLRAVESVAHPGELFRKNAWTSEFERIVRESDGVIFFGGPDIPPSIYGERQGFLTQIDDLFRHYLEVSAAFHLLGGSRNPGFRPLLEDRPSFPVLGICLGMQTLNVAAGGTLIQDIWSETYKVKTVEAAAALGPGAWHTNPQARFFPRRTVFPYFLHVIQFSAEGKLAGWTGLSPLDLPYVLSAHHQQMGRLGRGLRVEARSADGKVVEALSHHRFPNVLGVQFHPEFDLLWQGDTVYDLNARETSPMTVRAYLAGRPPSVKFHTGLWAWFCRVLGESAAARR